VADTDSPLSTVIGAEQGRRLRLTAHVENKPIGRLLTELLDAHLPTTGELADRIRSGPPQPRVTSLADLARTRGRTDDLAG
jgi:hypothetical protein